MKANLFMSFMSLSQCRKTQNLLIVLVLAVKLLILSTPAQAQVSVQDLQVTARALSFLESPLSGDVRIGIVHNPDNADSRRQAQVIQQVLAAGLQAGNIRLQAIMVPIAALETTDVDLFFLTGNLEDTAGLSQILDRLKKPSVTTDISLVRAGIATMGIQSSPRVEIIVNKERAELRETRFSSVFRMMIVEI